MGGSQGGRRPSRPRGATVNALPGHDGLERYSRSATARSRSGGRQSRRRGGALRRRGQDLSATYFWPIQSHASLGPSCAVADVRADGSATVWSASQGTHGLRTTLAKVFGLPAGQAAGRLPSKGRGPTGRTAPTTSPPMRVLLSKTIGAPVRVQWMRQDEHGWDPEGAATAARHAGGTRCGRPASSAGTPRCGCRRRRRARARCSRPMRQASTQDHGQNAGAITQNADPPYQPPTTSASSRICVKETPLAARPICARPARSPTCSPWKASPTNSPPPPASTDRVPPEPADAIRAPSRCIDARAAAFGWEYAAVAQPAGSAGRRCLSAAARLHALQAERELRRDGHGGRRRSGNGRIPSARHLRPRLRSGRQSRTRCAIRSRAASCRRSAERCTRKSRSTGSRVTSVDWVSYPVPAFPEVPPVEVILIDRRTSRIWAPAKPRRRRWPQPRERRLRCDRRTPADGAVHGRSREGRARSAGSRISHANTTVGRYGDRVWGYGLGPARQATPHRLLQKAPPKSVTLVGCLKPDGLFADVQGKDDDRLTGPRREGLRTASRCRSSALHRRKISVSGGLVPSPNVAAQAPGAIDPAGPAVSAASGAGGLSSNARQLPELRVKTVKVIAEKCVQ